MLSAQKKLLEASVAEQGAQLQSSELSYFQNNFSSMNTMASVIGGFAFSGLLIPTAYDTDGFLDGNNAWAVDFFYGFASLSVGSCMAAAITCTVVNVRGPGLALRGPDGSLKKAVDGMRKWQKYCLYALSIGIVSFHLEGMIYAWIALHKDSSQIVSTVVFVFFLFLMLVIALAVFSSFSIQGGGLVEGMLGEDQFKGAYKQLAGAPDYGATAEEAKAARRHARPAAEGKDEDELEHDADPSPSSLSTFFGFGAPAKAATAPSDAAALAQSPEKMLV